MLLDQIKTKKGLAFGIFATPMQLSFFIVFIFVCSYVLWRIASWFLSQNSHTLYFTTALLVLSSLLNSMHQEYRFYGKKMHVFIGDYLIYFWNFKLNKKRSS